ncbi:hypothetical protein [[Phormidium] sp. ETS-05]|uniref:hypothetical protein n=1 Tax=[Phormidium] sp. ETS-05 TaxID=222819 RepID=UPI0018EF26AE|nr:hypothetical protein [[Phormidium] sp. ETS-05]
MNDEPRLTTLPTEATETTDATPPKTRDVVTPDPRPKPEDNLSDALNAFAKAAAVELVWSWVGLLEPRNRVS